MVWVLDGVMLDQQQLALTASNNIVSKQTVGPVGDAGFHRTAQHLSDKHARTESVSGGQGNPSFGLDGLDVAECPSSRLKAQQGRSPSDGNHQGRQSQKVAFPYRPLKVLQYFLHQWQGAGDR